MNPLTEASPTSLQDLFDMDPLSLSDSDIEQVVRELRAQRERWAVAEKKIAGRGKTQVVAVSLDDLGV